MRVLNKKGGEPIPSLWCIGDANGKLMLAHAASAQVKDSVIYTCICLPFCLPL